MNIKRIINGKGRFSEVVRFAIVGGTATVIQVCIYIIFVNLVKVPAVPSTLISYVISFVFNYILSNYFTFHTRPSAINTFGFTMSHLINMGMQTGLVAIFKNIMPPTFAILPALAICIPANYSMVRFALTNKRFNSIRLKKSKWKDETPDSTSK